MAPANYKRPTAIITKKQIEAAQKKVEELGLTDALPRRHAHVEDISVNDVLFVNRDTRAKMKGGVFDMLSETSTVNPKEFTKAQEVSADAFVKNILPGAKEVSILVENRHIPNFVTLTAPENPDAGQLFKWNNNFAWVYNGSVADSFKEKVKAAGGNVDGFMRCSLHWFNYDDLDLHVTEPGGREIYYGSKTGATGGTLDVDMNAGSGRTRDAVENIIWTNPSRLRPGDYVVRVHNFCKRERIQTSALRWKSKLMESFTSSITKVEFQIGNLLRLPVSAQIDKEISLWFLLLKKVLHLSNPQTSGELIR